MGKNARIRKERAEIEKKQKKERLAKIYSEKNPWLKFWRRVDFWIYAVCVAFLIAYPFVGSLIPQASSSNDMATIHTSMGDIKIEFYTADAPKTVENFKKLANQGFYNDLLWHRVIKGFMIQGGDPNGDGTGGPGYTFADEINSHKIEAGTVAMANSGANTNGSQFFIVTEQPQPHLDGKHTVFAHVVEGLDIAVAISNAPTDSNDKPLSEIKINSIDLN